MRFTFFTLLLAHLFINTTAQSFPKGYFIMPINPGKPVSLSGAFADIRTNHFHAGLDIRTGGQEGKIVVAAADGYVSRMKVQNGGYGNALYVQHPNGYTTVYAHLKAYKDTLQRYLIAQQYAQKTWEIDLSLNVETFQVKKGDTIAFSGNTGGSGGPHLHFEIRDSNENACDPSQFGFSELRDTAPPVIEYILLKTVSQDARVNGRFGTFKFNLVKGKDGLYRIPAKIKATGKLALEVLAYDKTSNSPFRQGVNRIQLNVNQENAFTFRADKLSFHNKLDMNCHVNYERMISSGQKIHKCYVEEGNTLENYETNKEKGFFEIKPGLNNLKILVSDAMANTVVTYFEIENTDEKPNSTEPPKISYQHPYLYLETPSYGQPIPLKISYLNTEKNLVLNGDSSKLISHLIDLKDGLPTEIKLNEQALPMPINLCINTENTTVTLGMGTSVKLKNAPYYKHCGMFRSDDYAIDLHKDIVPLKGLVDINWVKSSPSGYPEKQKVYIDERKPKFLGGEWNKNVLSFKTKEYGRFISLYDFNAPAISPKIISPERIYLKISDDISGIKSMEAFLNGEWLLLNYEYKSGAIWAEKRDKNKLFEGDLVINITDNCQNIQTYSTQILPKP